MPDQEEKWILNSGYIESPFSPLDLWEDEILAGDVQPPPLPASYRVNGLTFRPQGAWPLCVAFSCLTLLEHKLKGRGFDEFLSRVHAFFNGGGTREGAWFRAVLDVLRLQGSQFNEVLPMPENLYDLSPFDALHVKALETPFEPGTGGLGYVRIIPTRERLKQVIFDHGPLLVGVAANGSAYWQPAHKRVDWPDNHAVLLVGWDDNDNWWVFDSLQPAKDFDGYHMLHESYTYNSAYAVVELPDDWRLRRQFARNEPFQHALNHYGKPRNYALEVKVANEMLHEFEQFGNKSVMDAAGKFWTVLTNMVAYGGYSISYTRFFMWQPGDVINFVYAWRRTGEFIFDPNKQRSEYP